MTHQADAPCPPSNPPGSTGEQLPADVLRLLPAVDYLSTACETAALLNAAAGEHPERAAELAGWRGQMHARCRLNHKFIGLFCRCGCHFPG